MSDTTLEKRIEGSPATRFLQEFFGNSAKGKEAPVAVYPLLD